MRNFYSSEIASNIETRSMKLFSLFILLVPCAFSKFQKYCRKKNEKFQIKCPKRNLPIIELLINLKAELPQMPNSFELDVPNNSVVFI